METFHDYFPPLEKIPFESNKKYHVFLSFHGKDVRKTLVDHLYNALDAAGLLVFLDSYKLQKGEPIGLTLEAAIKSSAIRIPIFSKGYANSVWCLQEAAIMANSDGLIIPLFYDVEPTNVRYPQSLCSPYEKAFRNHYSSGRCEKEEVDGWQTALEYICSHSGWTTAITEGFEAGLVKRVISDVVNTLEKVPLDIAKRPVGLESVMEELVQKLRLDVDDTIVRVGVLGIGGIGKSTVVKALYNKIHSKFRASSFVSKVSSTELTELQGIILQDMVNYSDKVRSVDVGKALMKDRLRSMPVLLILDDVNARDQLEALAEGWLSPGSRVIISSRDRHILNLGQVLPESICEMSGLKEADALLLFSWHAFLRPSPGNGFHVVSKQIVKACRGHPLSLVVIGALLYDKDIECWTETLGNIVANDDIFKNLQISYESLSDEEKEIFLDIACYFVGEKTGDPIILWRCMYARVNTTISNLSMKQLVKITDKGTFDMHAHLRDMGIMIAGLDTGDGGSQRCRLPNVTKIKSLFNCNCRENMNISRLRIDGGNTADIRRWKTPRLQYLHLQATQIGKPMGNFPSNLIWLRVDSCFFPGRVNNKLGDNKELKILDFRYCTELQQLPKSIATLSQLQSLVLSSCRNLQSLPITIGHLSQLQSLNLSSCWSLERLPDTIGKMLQLESLNLSYCYNLRSLPDTVGNLYKLKSLLMVRCDRLQSLPPSITDLTNLECLDLYRCNSLHGISVFLDKLVNLKYLRLEPAYQLYSQSAMGFVQFENIDRERTEKKGWWFRVRSVCQNIFSKNSNKRHIESSYEGNDHYHPHIDFINDGKINIANKYSLKLRREHPKLFSSVDGFSYTRN